MSGRVLIVEDEPKLAALLSDYLRQAGFETSRLDNGLEVAPRVREQSPDLILLDLMLPGRDGLEACKEIRAFSDVPIIMVTARIEEIDRLLSTVAWDRGGRSYALEGSVFVAGAVVQWLSYNFV